jgi:hypothetical protein
VSSRFCGSSSTRIRTGIGLAGRSLFARCWRPPAGPREVGREPRGSPGPAPASGIGRRRILSSLASMGSALGGLSSPRAMPHASSIRIGRSKGCRASGMAKVVDRSDHVC